MMNDIDLMTRIIILTILYIILNCIIKKKGGDQKEAHRRSFSSFSDLISGYFPPTNLSVAQRLPARSSSPEGPMDSP